MEANIMKYCMEANIMKYCMEANLSHPAWHNYSTCIQDLNKVLHKEGYDGPDLFSLGYQVLNLDLVEAIVALSEGNRNRNRSMDLTFGISDTSLSQKNMLLVELRLNYRNLNNLKKDPLMEKVNGSSQILSNIIPIYGNYIFIFTIGKTEEARSRLFRMNPRVPNNYIAMDLNEFKSTFFE